MTNVPKARDVMVSPVITISQSLSIYKAIDILIENEISGAPVLDDSGKLIGMISEKDCLKVLSKGVVDVFVVLNVA